MRKRNAAIKLRAEAACRLCRGGAAKPKGNRRQLTHEARAEAKFTLIMPCKKEENGTLNRVQKTIKNRTPWRSAAPILYKWINQIFSREMGALW